ncbi:MAG: type IV pilus assembly protein PilM [Planctomycetes bacterium]|nr:type IV pilus assembly protein PilM [Planctomycetota bacterium]
MALFGRGKSLLGLDIGTSSVKAIELSRSGSGLVISGYGSAPIESPDTLAETIQTLLKDSGIRTKRCATSVSGRSVIIRQVPMAQVPDADLRQAIEYEADKYIPFDVNEVQLDVQRLSAIDGETAQGQMKVLLVAVKRSLIDEHIALLQSVGLQPAIIDVDCFALGNAFELRNLSLGVADDEVRALIDIGASKTNINIMRGNNSFFQREIYVAGNDLTEAIAKRFGEDPKDVEKMKKEPGGALESMQDAMLPVLEDIGNEIRLSFDYFENQYDKQVKEVFISGGSAYFPGMDTMFTQIFNLPTKVWDPTEGLEITGVNPAGMGGANSDMTVALGLASRILGSLGWTAHSSMISTASSAAPVETGVSAPTAVARPTTIGAAQAMASAEARKHWIKGLGIGIGGATAMALAMAFVQTLGYTPWYVIFEAIPIGLALGFGMFFGSKAIRPIPGRMSVVMNALLAATVACGVLFGIRMGMGQPFKAQHKVEKPNLGIDTSKMPKVPEALAQKLEKARAERDQKFDADDITAYVQLLTHWLGSAAIGMIIVWTQFVAASRRESRQGWIKPTSAGG